VLYFSCPHTYYYYLFRQPVSNRVSKRPPVSCPDQTYRYQIPFYLMDHWKRENTADLLPHWRYDSWRIHKGTSLCKSQAFHKWAWSCHSLRESVGDQTATKTKRIVARCSSPLGACSQGYCCQWKSLNIAVLLYIPQFSLSSRYWG